MGRPGDSFRRPKARFRPQPTVLVICEDSKSSLRYLQDVTRYFRVDVKVDVTHCGKTDPKSIVEEALGLEHKFDELYCVIDRDSHELFGQALDLCKASKKVKVIASYPCYEFWLLLHYGYCRKPYNAVGAKSSGDRLIDDLRKKPGMETYDKTGDRNIFELLVGDKFAGARKNSPKVLAEAIADGNFNPSTELHILIDKFEGLSTPKPVA